jgi:NAD(P)-dependent dehydrogenase (short-subunit alcohol dehydrogenase family)
VYITGRTTEEGRGQGGLRGTIYGTAEAVTRLGAQCTAIRCDHRNDDEVEGVFRRVVAEQGRLDILVNNVWGGYENMVIDGRYIADDPFWQQPIWRWDSMFASGVRAHYVASIFAAPTMVAQHSGLIVNISFWAGQRYLSSVAYGVAKAADDRMARDMAHELRPHNVAALALYPGLVRTEAVLRDAQYFDLSNSESPQFTGRAVAALAADPTIMQRSGGVYVVAALAQQYGFTDIDGTQPQPARWEEDS